MLLFARLRRYYPVQKALFSKGETPTTVNTLRSKQTLGVQECLNGGVKCDKR